MKEEIDEGVLIHCKYLNENGVTTLFSCDGMVSHHEGEIIEPMLGYISMVKNDKSMQIITLAFKEGFGCFIGEDKAAFYYQNREGENSEKAFELIKKGIHEKIDDNDQNNIYVQEINNYIVKAAEKNVIINIELNYDYIFYSVPATKKRDKNRLRIIFDDLEALNEFYNQIKKEYNIGKQGKSILMFYNKKDELNFLFNFIDNYFEL